MTTMAQLQRLFDAQPWHVKLRVKVWVWFWFRSAVWRWRLGNWKRVLDLR